MGIPIRIETGFKEQAYGGDNSDNSKDQHGRSTPRKMGDVAQVMGFFLERVDHDRPQTLEIGEGQFNLALLCPSAGGRN